MMTMRQGLMVVLGGLAMRWAATAGAGTRRTRLPPYTAMWGFIPGGHVMRMAMMQLVGILASGTVLLALLIAPAHAIVIQNASLSSGTVSVSGSQAVKSANITWEGTVVTKSTKGGAFTFTTAVVPSDCVGTLSDGVSTIDVAISGCPSPTDLPATGQTTCWDSSFNATTCTGTGQDGEIQAGATLSYTDNGDGTITDNNTKLMWEKLSMDSSIHDVGNPYTWANAFAVHIAGLNAGSGFAGHTDWRLPNVKELQSIIDYENSGPAVATAFNNSCSSPCTVLTCSCTAAASDYWSSSSYLGDPSRAWLVDFNGGFVGVGDKTGHPRVRAVRGGL